MNGNWIVIGLTGGIATGKSTVAQILAELGAKTMDADVLAHQAMRSGSASWKQIVDAFGEQVLGNGREIDRMRLGSLVFSDTEAMARLERIVHPVVVSECRRMLRELRDRQMAPSTMPVVVLEAIKLIESGMQQECDEVWVVTAPLEQQVQRLMGTRGLTMDEARLRIGSQQPPEKNLAMADVVIDNGGDLERTRAQIIAEWKRLETKYLSMSGGASKPSSGGNMSSWRKFVDAHPRLAMWAVLAVGMVVIFLLTSRDVDLEVSQRLFMALACVAVAGISTWIVHWE